MRIAEEKKRKKAEIRIQSVKEQTGKLISAWRVFKSQAILHKKKVLNKSECTKFLQCYYCEDKISSVLAMFTGLALLTLVKLPEMEDLYKITNDIVIMDLDQEESQKKQLQDSVSIEEVEKIVLLNLEKL